MNGTMLLLLSLVRHRKQYSIPLPETPVTDKHVSLSERNRQICVRYAAGETLEEIAREFDISHQIIRRWC
jgi:DNA-binding NarL/FixJ family response regulator